DAYEMAYRLQTSAPELMDLSSEPVEVLEMYGIKDVHESSYARNCLLARRLAERGVRFVQLFHEVWDQHGDLTGGVTRNAAATDQASAALVKDLKQRGLLDETLVHWGGEMGRLPVIQNDAGVAKQGRDHNTYGFSMWLAGGGLKGGMTYGETDDFGHHAVKDKVSHSDYHATLMHLFGLDAERLTFTRNGAPQTLIDGQENRVVKEIIA
ncbi:MAG: DUF1501 domain-containing protein, partial [Planctomycetaceae bacterium]|nr:DUF1501 domain-containing protein [Planctomycetaceae bacterium]